jgi:integrase/recombinase XerC
MKGTIDLGDFRDFLARVQGKSTATVEAYCRDAAAFCEYCTEQGITVQAGLAKAQVGLYLVARIGKQRRGTDDQARLSTRSAARHVSALQALAHFLVFSGEIKENPLTGFKAPKYSRQLPTYFSSDEIRQVVCAFDGAADSKPLFIRNAAILHLLYATGLRVSECASLNLGALDTKQRLVHALGKGRKHRLVPFGEQAAQALERYLRSARPALANEHSADALWLNRNGGRLSARAMRNILNTAVERASLVKHISPHKLRHACATHLLEGGADVRQVQELLGHESINTTQTYTQITRTHLRDVYEKTHPRAERKD